MLMSRLRRALTALSLGTFLLPGMMAISALAAGEAIEIKRQKWSFGGMFGQFDKAQLQRGFQVYQEVCAACHGLKRVNVRNLADDGGPGFPEDSLKALAAKFKVEDGPNDEGKMFQRPGRLADPLPSPFKNEQEARSINNGAYPPDLSLIAKARNVEYSGSLWFHPFSMLRDVVNAYQEGGADYLYALLTSYGDPPADMKLADGMYYNKAFPGHQIAMVPPVQDGQITYTADTKQRHGVQETVDQYARDVAAFLSWTADPTLDQRKRLGWIVMVYLLITAVLFYFAKRSTWAKMH